MLMEVMVGVAAAAPAVVPNPSIKNPAAGCVLTALDRPTCLPPTNTPIDRPNTTKDPGPAHHPRRRAGEAAAASQGQGRAGAGPVSGDGAERAAQGAVGVYRHHEAAGGTGPCLFDGLIE